jgi:anti-sigma factor RsiW
MNCEETSTLLDAYVDQELFLKDSLEIEKHLKLCTACRNKYSNLMSLRKTFSHYPKYSPGTGLQDRIQKSLGESIKTGFNLRMINWLKTGAPSFAAGVFAAVLVFGQMFASDKGSFVVDELVASHVRSLMAAHLTDVAASDKHTVKPWLSKILDFSPPVDDLAGQGYPLLGARLDYVDERQVVALVYQAQNHYINLFIWPVRDRLQLSSKAANRHGYQIRYWENNGLHFAAVSDVNRQSLNQFVLQFQQATKTM